MVGSYAEELRDFHAWRQSPEVLLPGIGGPNFETQCFFISQFKLEEYFKVPGRVENLLNAVLGEGEALKINANFLRDHYARSFAILLCIEEGPMIRLFRWEDNLRDEKLPHRTRPVGFPDMASDKFEAFQKEQWKFCAQKLRAGMNFRFQVDHILPIILREQIGSGGSATVYKIVVDSHYNLLRSPACDHPAPLTNTFVMKTYRPPDAEKYFNTERDAHMTVINGGSQPSPHVIAYYGGFVHGDSYNNIFEYADQGTLDNFMRRTDPPKECEATLLVWYRFIHIIHGIARIHGFVRGDSSASKHLTGWHQDVKPANILCFGGDRVDPCDREFKIGDLGLAHFKPKVPHSNDLTDFDAFGTRAYGAPETYRILEDPESVPLQVTPSVDMWSIGCVLSEFTVWVFYGWKRVLEYRRQRSEEIKRRGGPEGEHTFHFDNDILETVRNIHQTMRKARTASQSITILILDQVVEDLLQPGPRPDAVVTFNKSERLVKKIARQFDIPLDRLGKNSLSEPTEITASRDGPSREPPVPDDIVMAVSPGLMTQTFPHRPRHESTTQESKYLGNGFTETPQSGQPKPVDSIYPRPSPSAHLNGKHKFLQHPCSLVRPTLSVDAGLAWKEKKKRGSLDTLPGDENLATLHERDHLFLVDSSASMQEHKKDVRKVILLLAYMTKKSDEDGLDLYFTQKSEVINSKKSTKLANSIYDENFKGSSDMRGRLQAVLKPHIAKFGSQVSSRKRYGIFSSPLRPQRSLSVYILTDGKYQSNDVGAVIKHLVHCLRVKGLNKEHVGLSFIRFGNDEASIRELNKLDHGLGLNAIGMDIVDHTYWNDNVWKMLLGALNDWYDDDPPQETTGSDPNIVLPE